MVGTSNNEERTGDRDLGFSNLMREPKGMRSCDIDVSPVCRRCKNYFVFFEAKRWNISRPELTLSFRGRDEIQKHSRYTVNSAKRQGIPAYFVASTDEWQTIDVVRLEDWFGMQMTRIEFVQWLERRALEHLECCPGEE